MRPAERTGIPRPAPPPVPMMHRTGSGPRSLRGSRRPATCAARAHRTPGRPGPPAAPPPTSTRRSPPRYARPNRYSAPPTPRAAGSPRGSPPAGRPARPPWPVARPRRHRRSPDRAMRSGSSLPLLLVEVVWRKERTPTVSCLRVREQSSCGCHSMIRLPARKQKAPAATGGRGSVDAFGTSRRRAMPARAPPGSERRPERDREDPAPVWPVHRERIVQAEYRVENVEAEPEPVAEQRLPEQVRVLARLPVPDHPDILPLPRSTLVRPGEIRLETDLVVPRNAAIEEQYRVHRREVAQETDLELRDDREPQLEVHERRTGPDQLVPHRARRHRRAVAVEPALRALSAPHVERVAVVPADEIRPAPVQREAVRIPAEAAQRHEPARQHHAPLPVQVVPEVDERFRELEIAEAARNLGPVPPAVARPGPAEERIVEHDRRRRLEVPRISEPLIPLDRLPRTQHLPPVHQVPLEVRRARPELQAAERAERIGDQTLGRADHVPEQDVRHDPFRPAPTEVNVEEVGPEVSIQRDLLGG